MIGLQISWALQSSPLLFQACFNEVFKEKRSKAAGVILVFLEDKSVEPCATAQASPEMDFKPTVQEVGELVKACN